MRRSVIVVLSGMLAVAALVLQPRAWPQESAAPGKAVFDKWCAPCHGDGPGKPGTMVLSQRYGDRIPALLEERNDMTPEYLRTFVREGVGVMPQFRKTEITDSELDAMIDYLAR